MASGLGSEIVKSLFGANLEEQGRGFYVTLELLAIIRGVLDFAPDELLSPDVELISYRRSSHDLARRIATSEEIPIGTLDEAMQGAQTLETLRALTSSLTVDIPGRRRAPRWFAAHLYPFVGELIHYDAVERRGSPSIERYLFRGGGAWAYRALREDIDTVRRAKTTSEIALLVRDSDTALGRVAAALKTHDSAAPKVWDDEAESTINLKSDVSPWPEHLRRGVSFISARVSISSAKRIEQLMHWVPYCLARHQLHLARLKLGLPREVVLVDATTEANPLRRRSQESLDDYRRNISAALIEHAADLMTKAGESVAEQYLPFTLPGASFTRSPRAFFSESLAAVGALNSTSGKRHFTFKPPLLEALAAATIPPDGEQEMYDFCRTVYEDYGVVLDDRIAAEAGLTVDVDGGVFAANARAFRGRLAATGLLTHYSDATSIVRGEHR